MQSIGHCMLKKRSNQSGIGDELGILMRQNKAVEVMAANIHFMAQF